MSTMKMISMSVALILAFAFVLACKKEEPPGPPVEVASYSLDDLDHVIMGDYLTLDTETPAEGTACVKMSSEMPITIDLYEAPLSSPEKGALVLEGQIRTEEMAGSAFLRMEATLSGGATAAKRQKLSTAPSGTADWTPCEVVLYLSEKARPSRVKISFVLDGFGTAWVDDLHLIHDPGRVPPEKAKKK